MKTFVTLTLTILVAMLPQLHGKPVDDLEEQAIAELLKDFLQEEKIAQVMHVTDLAVTKQDAAIAGAGTGVTYTRWGHGDCPALPGNKCLYSGVVAGVFYNQKGGGSNYLCLPDHPDDGDLKTAFSRDYSRIFGAEYEFPLVGTHDHGVPCASCYASTRSAQLMIPAKTICPTGWTREYYGYIMSEGNWNDRSRNEYICVDKEQASLRGSIGNQNGVVLYHVRATCTGIHCPPYNAGKALTCTVCSK